MTPAVHPPLLWCLNIPLAVDEHAVELAGRRYVPHLWSLSPPEVELVSSPIPPLSSLTSSLFFARFSPRYLRHLPILARHLDFHHDPLLVRSSSTQPISFPRCALGPDRPPFPPSLYPRSLAVALMAFSYELLQSKINLYNRRVATSLVLNYPASSPGAASVGRSASPEGGSFPAGMR